MHTIRAGLCLSSCARAAPLLRRGYCTLLDDAPLQAPRFHNIDWFEGQTFDYEDDPDRCNVGDWEPPNFLAWADPTERAQSATVESIDVTSTEGFTADYSFAKLIRNVLTESECAQLIACVNKKGFTPALVNFGGGRQRLVRSYRDGHRMIQDSPLLTDWLFQVLRSHLPRSMNGSNSPWSSDLDDDTLELSGLNERCRFLCYSPGQVFTAHYDGGEQLHGKYSMATVQLYLHDLPEEDGGATSFVPDAQGWNDGMPMQQFQPAAGTALVFTQDLLHEGSRLYRGLKYTMRTEAMYQPRGQLE